MSVVFRFSTGLVVIGWLWFLLGILDFFVLHPRIKSNSDPLGEFLYLINLVGMMAAIGLVTGWCVSRRPRASDRRLRFHLFTFIACAFASALIFLGRRLAW